MAALWPDRAANQVLVGRTDVLYQLASSGRLLAAADWRSSYWGRGGDRETACRVAQRDAAGKAGPQFGFRVFRQTPCSRTAALWSW
jgi:hypothetical protein